MQNKFKAFLLIAISSSLFGFISFSFTNNLETGHQTKINGNEFIKEDRTTVNGKVLCLILTTEDKIKDQALPVWNNWAKYCHKSRFVLNAMNLTNILKYSNNKSYFSNEDEYKMILNLPIMHLNIIENYDRMAEKVLLSVKKSFDEYHDEYKWFLLVDDDTFIFVNHLYNFILNRSYDDPVTYGYNFKTLVPTGYHSGGGGILMTYEAIKRISKNIENGICAEKTGYGDVALGRCAYKANITLGNSLDELGRERFHYNAFPHHFKGIHPQWAYDYSSNPIRNGIDCCSDQSISFHYTSIEQMNFYANMFNQTFFKNIYKDFKKK